MKLAVVGSRSCREWDFVRRVLDREKPSEIISGGAKGADSLAEHWANQNNVPTRIFLPDWERHGKGAGFIRNADIVNHCDKLIAFWGGESKGTEHSIALARSAGKIVEVFRL